MNGIIWMTNPQNDTLDNLMAYIREYAAEYLSQASIACRFDIPDTVPPVHLYGTLRRNIFLTVKEALNNIVKHARASETTIALIFQHNRFQHDHRNASASQQESDDNAAYRFQLRISDNGKGVNDADVSRFGNGLDNMRRRMEECNCQFTVLTEGGRGTVITLDIVIFPTPYLNLEQP
jgi:signal transduction histidine kinase